MIRCKIASHAAACAKRMTFLWALLTLALHLSPGIVTPAHAQGSRKDDIVFNSRGIPLAGSTIRVCVMPASGQPCTPLAQIFSDAALTQALANPTSTDGLGNYFFYAAPGKYEIEITGPGIATKQIPNVILPNDPSSPTFSSLSTSGAISAFSLNLGGNLTVTGNATVLGSLVSGTLNMTNQGSAPGTPGLGTVNLYSKTADKRLYYKDDTGTEIGPIAATSGAQSNVVNTFTAQQNFDGDMRLKGPNPYVDVRAFGKFATLSSTTVNTTSGSANVSLASAQNFQNGEYVTIYNAGAACGLSAPSGPTVTPSVNAGGLNTIATNTGATSYNYKVIAADQFGCYTAASPATSIANGNALGLQSATVSSWSRSGTTVTVTTSAAHPFVVNEMVHFRYFTSSDGSVEGFWIVASVPDNTHFTFSSGQNANLGASTSGTGGTIYGFNANAITWTAVPNAWKYYIFGRNGGTFALLGQTLSNKWVDYGSPMNDNQTFPAFIPATAPASGANDHLTAKITSGGGTTTLTLATSAGATLTGTTVVSDDGPALVAAVNTASCAANSLSVPVYVSHTGITINSYTKPTTCGPAVKLLLAGTVTLNDTLEITNLGEIRSWGGGSSPSFAWNTSAPINATKGSYPALYTQGSAQILENLSISSNLTNGALLYLADNPSNPNTNLTFDRVAWGTSTSSGDYLGMHAIFRGGGFSYRFWQNTFNTGNNAANDNTDIGKSPIPTMLFTPSAGGTPTNNVYVYNSWFVQRSSIDVDNNTLGINGVMMHDIQAQSSNIPVLQFTSAPGLSGGQAGGVDLDEIGEADRATAFLAIYGPINISNISANTVTCNTGNRAMIVGIPTGDVWVRNVCNSGYSPSTSIGMSSSLGVVRSTSMGSSLAPPPAPASCAVSTGGSVPVGAWTYTYEGIDVLGNRTTQGLACTATTTSGNQTVTVIPPAATAFPAGTVALYLFRAGGGGAARVNFTPCGSTLSLATTFVDTFSFTCGNSADSTNLALNNQIGSNGISTTSFTEVANGFTLTHSTPTTTANRTYTNPDVSGYIPVSSYLNGAYDNATRANGAIGANWTVANNGINISSNNFVGTAGTSDIAYWSASPFSSSQYSQVTITSFNGTSDFPGVAVLLSGSGGSTQGYECVENTVNIYIQKISGTSNTTLTSTATTGTIGDVLRLEAGPAGSLTCYKNGVSTLTATDTSYTSGQPGLFLFGTVATSKNWSGGNLHPLAHLDVEQDWTKAQHFVQGVALAGESLSSSPRSEQNVFLPGALTSTWTGTTWTADKAITVTRLQVQAKTAPSGCTTNATVRLTDGAAPVNVTITAAANDSGPIAQNYAAGASLTIGVQIAAAGCTTSPADANVVVQYKMQ